MSRIQAKQTLMTARIPIAISGLALAALIFTGWGTVIGAAAGAGTGAAA